MQQLVEYAELPHTLHVFLVVFVAWLFVCVVIGFRASRNGYVNETLDGFVPSDTSPDEACRPSREKRRRNDTSCP